MKTICFIAFFLVVLIFIVIAIVIHICTITETINDTERNAESTAEGNNIPWSNGIPTKLATISFKATTTIITTTKEPTKTKTITSNNNKYNGLNVSAGKGEENTETLLSAAMPSKLMTVQKIEISAAKPSDFNKNSLWQREGQQEYYQHQHQHEHQQQKQQEKQQQQSKQQYILDNKHPPCDYVEHASGSIVTGGFGETTFTVRITASTDTNDTNLDNKIRTMTKTQIDATAKGYKPLMSLNTSNSVDDTNTKSNSNTNNDVATEPLNLLSPSPLPSPSPPSSPSSLKFNVARNGFRDKINISNQRNEFTSEVDNNDTDDDYDDYEKYNSHNDVAVKDSIQVVQSTSKLFQNYNNNKNYISRGLNSSSINLNLTLNSNTNSTSNINNYTVPAMSSVFEHIEQVESRLSPDKRHELLLHRRKRYLVFPEGSSFQLVFDLIIGIVDYTNFAILGITCSVAWELPSKPPSEIIENVRDKLNDGTYGLQRRNDSVDDKELQYIATDGQTKASTTPETPSPKLPTNIGYENAWKPQKYIDTGKWNYYEQKYGVKPTKATTTGLNYYEYKYRNQYESLNSDHGKKIADSPATLSDLASGSGFADDQRKTLNEKATQLEWHWNRQKPDKIYSKYDKKYSTKQNYDWRDNDKWKYAAAPYAAVSDDADGDWHQDRTGNGGYANNRGAYIADNVKFNERQKLQQQHKNWRQKENGWQRNNQRWDNNWQQWSQSENFNRYIPNKPIYSDKFRSYARAGRQRKILKEPPKHRIYPVFGRKRRSLKNNEHSSELSFELALERIHFREQLQSRQKLYGKIEQLFQTRGHNGTACVLRALCETGQRHHQTRLHHLQHGHHHYHHYYYHDGDQQQEPHSTAGQQSGPQSFITELLRAIFALPKDIRSREYDYENESDALHASHAGRRPSSIELHLNATHEMLLEHEFAAQISSHYRDAHEYSGNCAERFSSCEHSIWYDGIQRNGAVGQAFKM